MTTLAPRVVDPHLLAELQRLGAPDVSACVSCGNCTAVCPLADNDGTFPRRLVRYGVVGLRDELLSSKELWTCYHCAACSESCPMEADPGAYMAAARRYAITRYDPTGVARLLATRPLASLGVLATLAALFAALLTLDHGTAPTDRLDLFRFVPDATIHWTGIAVMVVVVLVALGGLVSMIRGVARREGLGARHLLAGRAGWAHGWRAAWDAAIVESLGQRRYREDCTTGTPEPWYRRRWIAHALTMWGFLGLLAATVLDYGLALLHVRATGTPEPVWYPVRLLGTVAGLALLVGVTTLLVNRARRVTTSVEHSEPGDWLLLGMLWLVGASGLATEVALYVGGGPAWGYGVFLAHVALALELLVLLPVMKFAHVLYRPVALFFHSLVRATPGS